MSAGSPRPPVVAPAPAPAPEPDSSPEPTAVTAGMSPVAVEAALAELAAWRRDADRRILHLETEVIQLRSNGASHGGPPTLDLSAVTAPGVTMPAPVKEPVPPWAVAHPPAHVAPVMAPAALHAPLPAVAAYVAPPVVAPPVAAPPVAAHAQQAQYVQPAASYVPSPPQVYSIAPRPSVTPQYDLEMKPGEHFDMPSGLDGGRRKRRLVGFVMTLIVVGMAVLVITAMVSQR